MSTKNYFSRYRQCSSSWVFSRRTLQAAAFLSLLISLLHPAAVLGQSSIPSQTTSRASDLNLRSNLRVNPSTLAVEFQLTLGNYPGRGGLAVPITLNYSSKVWRMAFQSYKPPVQITFDGQFSEDSTDIAALYLGGWTSNVGVPVISHDDDSSRYSQFGLPLPEATNCNSTACFRIDRILIRMPDNSVRELRSSDQPYSIGNGFSLPSPIPDNLYAVDGSGLRFQRSTQTLFLPDGSRYIISNTAPRFIDRNGNTLTFNGDTPSDIQNNLNIGVTDSLNKTIPAFTRPGNTNTDFTYSLPGVNAVDVAYTVKWRHLGDPDVMTTTQPLHYISEVGGVPTLFSSDSANRIYIADATRFNPLVLHQVVLPTGQSYTFNYNVYGEVEKVVFPSGGYERYEYTGLMPLSTISPLYAQANRGVSRRYVSSTGNSADEVTWSYTYTGTFSSQGNLQGAYVITTTAPDGSLVDRYVHTDSLLSSFGYDIDEGKAGMIYEERQYSAPDVAGTRRLLQRKLTEWVTSGSNATQPQAQQTARRNARVAKEVSILLDTGTNSALAKTTLHNYDLTSEFTIGPIETSVAEYGFAIVLDQTIAKTGAIGSIPMGNQLLRTAEVTNVLLDANITQVKRDAYRARHLVTLPSSTRLKDGGGNIVAQASIDYDEYALTTVGSVSGWTDPQTTFRGNATTRRRWLNTTGNDLQAHKNYDQFGNVRTVTDAKGIQTQFGYSTNHAYLTTITTAVPDPSGQYGANVAFTSTTAYDVTTGLVLSRTDFNGQTTSMTYNDPLNRLKQVTRPDGAHISYSYSDVPGNLYTKILADQDSSRSIETRTYFDGIGRAVRSFLYDGTTSTPWVVNDTYYNVMGRVSRVSNPYRVASPSGSVPAICSVCTTSAYDALGRVISTTTADNSTLTAAYAGITSGTPSTTVLITDQTGKKRKTVSDALGRLTEVYEDPTPGLNYQTTYSYDVIGNLKKVTQDSQIRDFVYDSLSRLRSATNPESGTTLYQYDDNGNLTQKTDARGIVSVYTYDVFNRNTKIDYSNTADINPDVSRIYDGAIKGKGRLWYSYAGGSESAGSDVEKTLVASYDGMGRPLIQRQLFKKNGTWSSQLYEISRNYNLAGAVTSQNYPSGRSVSYNYDAAGRPESFSGNLGDNNTRTYSSGITYTPTGQLKQEQFGTTTTVYNKLLYNSRQQLAEILVSTTVGDTWNRGKILNQYSLQCSGAGCNATDNNGNLRKQQVYVPGDDQVSTYTSWYQQYDYDDVNRLKRVHEYTVQPQATEKDWQQEYLYDRWGNRRIDTLTTHTYGIGINNREFEKEDATNRLYAPGDIALADNLRRIQYDAAGNQKKDAYTGYGNATFDAENRITAIQDNLGGWSTYTYNADGRRARRKIGNAETWQIYGFDGELVAEYSENAAVTSPRKEYGYRNGQLLVVASPGSEQSIGLNGTTAYVLVPNSSSVNITAAITVEAWIKINAITGAYQDIITRESYGQAGTGGGFEFCLTNIGKVRLDLYHGPTAYTPLVGSTTLTTGVWHHVAGVFDGSQLRVYLDGVLDGALATTNAPATGTSSLKIGRSSFGSYFGGLIDEARVSNTALYAGNFTPQTHLTATSSTKGLWKFDSQSPADSSGNGNNGTLQGGAVFSTDVPTGPSTSYYSGSFNGTAAYILVPNSSSVNITAAITVEAWIKINAITGAYQDIITRESYGQAGTGGGFEFCLTNIGKVRLDLYHGPTAYTPLVGSTTLTTGVWHHVAGVFDGSQLRVYLDGVLDGALATTNAPATGTSSLKIGRSSFGSYFGGLIDEARVSNTALYAGNFTPQTHLTATSSTKGLWKFDSQSPADSSGNGNNGTLQGGATYSNDVPGGGGGGGTSGGTGPQVQWLVADHLGTPRMILDQTGSLGNMKRHDYLPFGEELFAVTGNRSGQNGYGCAQGQQGCTVDNIRQQFTQQERDIETGLDYFDARYFANVQGRFISVDPENAGAKLQDPQSWNAYAYVGNAPLTFHDPTGLWKQVPCNSGKGMCWEAEGGDSIGSLAEKLGLNFDKLNRHFQRPNVQAGQIYDISGFFRNNNTVIYDNIVEVLLVTEPPLPEGEVYLMAAVPALNADPEPRSRIIGEIGVVALYLYLNEQRRQEWATYVPPPQNLPAFPDAVRVTRKGDRVRWQDSDGNIYEWDYQHGRVEKYDRRGRHLGEYDPETGIQTSPPNPSRRIEP